MDEIREAGMKQLERFTDETLEHKVYRIGAELFGNDPGLTYAEYSKDPVFITTVSLVKRVMEEYV